MSAQPTIPRWKDTPTDGESEVRSISIGPFEAVLGIYQKVPNPTQDEGAPDDIPIIVSRWLRHRQSTEIKGESWFVGNELIVRLEKGRGEEALEKLLKKLLEEPSKESSKLWDKWRPFIKIEPLHRESNLFLVRVTKEVEIADTDEKRPWNFLDLCDEWLRFSGKKKISLGPSELTQIELVKDLVEDAASLKYLELNHLQFIQSHGDPYLKDQWGIRAVKAEEAWEAACPPVPRTRVAIVDSGLDYLHADLKDNIELQADGDHSHGKSQMDEAHSHGTCCGGVVGAVSNTLGVVGVNPEPVLGSFKFIGADRFGKADDAAKEIRRAADDGFQVILAAWGTHDLNCCLYDACKYAAQSGKGVLIVAAVGNFDENIDQHRFFPAAFNVRNQCRDILWWLCRLVGKTRAARDLTPLGNVLAVGGTKGYGYDGGGPRKSRLEMKADGSNWGREVVDIGAPGYAIRTIQRSYDGESVSERLAWAGGTSLAAAFVAGAAALVRSVKCELDAVGLRQQIIGSADLIDTLEEYWPYGRRLNVLKAVTSSKKDLFHEQIPGARPSDHLHPPCRVDQYGHGKSDLTTKAKPDQRTDQVDSEDH